MAKKIKFPASFISLSYNCEQNEPSEPHRQLVNASSRKELEEKAKLLFIECFGLDEDQDDAEYREECKKKIAKLKLVSENYYGDFAMRSEDDECLFLTRLDGEPVVQR